MMRLAAAFVVASAVSASAADAPILDSARRDGIQSRLQGLIDREAGTLRVKVYSRDGTIRYSDVPSLVGLLKHQDAEVRRQRRENVG